MKKLRGQETIICHMVLQIFDAIGLGAILFIILYKIVGSEAALYVCFAITLLIRLFSEKKYLFKEGYERVTIKIKW